MLSRHCAAGLVAGLALLVGCSRLEYPTPDGSSGVQGTCWLPPSAESERQPWTTAEIRATIVNTDRYEWKEVARVTADGEGRFRIPLIPGDYLLGLSTSPELKGKMTRPVFIKVQADQFTDVTIDYNQVYPEHERKVR